VQQLVFNVGESIPSLLFRTRRHHCALPLAHVVETMRPLPVEEISGAPLAVKGMAVIRGEPIPVLDVGLLLNDADEACTRFVIVRTGERRVALAVASIVGLRNLSAEMLRTMPPLFSDTSEGGVAAVGALDADLLLLLNAAHLVPESVWSAINAPGETSSP
jgi:purine-binding chemotaxis protein CheW